MKKIFLFHLVYLTMIGCSSNMLTYENKIATNLDFNKTKYKDAYLTLCFYEFTDDKKWKDWTSCTGFGEFREKDSHVMDSINAGVKVQLNNIILSKSEGKASLYYYGPNGTNLLEDSLKSTSIVSYPISYDCLTQACMTIYRSKELDKLAEEYARWRIKDLQRQRSEEELKNKK